MIAGLAAARARVCSALCDSPLTAEHATPEGTLSASRSGSVSNGHVGLKAIAPGGKS